MEKDHNSALLSQIAASPTAFHAVDTARRRLEEDGYTALDPSARWQLVPGGKYYLTANGSTLLAFRLPQGQPTGFLIAAAHSDAPCFKIKPGCEGAAAGHYVRLNTERYGGTLLNTWFDRPLAIAGRVLVEEDGRVVSHLVGPMENAAIIPSVAPHLNSEANNGFKANPAVDLQPLWTLCGGEGSFAVDNIGLFTAQEGQLLADPLCRAVLLNISSRTQAEGAFYYFAFGCHITPPPLPLLYVPVLRR